MLWEQQKVDCVLLDVWSEPDKRGASRVTFTDGKPFRAAIVQDDSPASRAADRESTQAVYTITTGKEMKLAFRQYFKRLSDGKIFRVLDGGDGKFTPASAVLNMRQVKAQEVRHE